MNLLKLKEFKKTIVNSNATINNVVKSLNISGLKIVLIVKKNKFLGTIVDGDIRRGLLKGISLKDNIKKIINKKPITVGINVKKKEAIYLMKEHEIQHIPVLNKKKNIIGLFINTDLVESTKRDIKFVIMAGGFGKRLLPLTQKKPKALIKVFNKPMIEHIIIEDRNSLSYFSILFFQ